MDKLVSVIIPTYNSEKTIERCINSFFVQTYSNIEIIVVDDGSKDSTVEIVKEIQKRDAKVFLIEKENGGPSSARNMGIKNAKGKFVCFADSDDYVDNDYVEILISGFQKYDTDLSVCGVVYRYATHDEGFGITSGPDIISINEYKFQMFIPQDKAWGGYSCNKMFKKQIIDEYNVRYPEEYVVFEDIAFNLDYAKHCRNVYCSYTSPYYYMINNLSITKKVSHEDRVIQKWLGWGDAFDLFIGEEEDKKIKKLFTMQKTVHISTAVRVLSHYGLTKHPKYKEKRKFLRKNIICFLLYRYIPLKKRAGALITLLFPKAAYKLWNSKK